MNDRSDAQLLRDYADQGDEAAFREIVARHTDLVYSSALRQVESPDLEGDIAQQVFGDLARKAKPVGDQLRAEVSVSGWLHRSTHYALLERQEALPKALAQAYNASYTDSVRIAQHTRKSDLDSS